MLAHNTSNTTKNAKNRIKLQTFYRNEGRKITTDRTEKEGETVISAILNGAESNNYES